MSELEATESLHWELELSQDSADQEFPDRGLPDQEFPTAIPSQEWYEYPPIEAGAPKPFSNTRLGRLPTDNRLDILDYVKDGKAVWDITEFTRRRDIPRVYLQYAEDLKGPLGACRGLRKECHSLLTTTTAFHASRPDRLSNLTFQIGGENLSLIRFFKLEASVGLKVYHEGNFPRALEFLCKQLPNLMRFQLYSRYSNTDLLTTQAKYADLPGTTRHQQEVRALLRFGAFLVKRQQNLDLLIWPSDSPEIKERYGDEDYTSYIDVVANTLRIKRSTVAKESTKADTATIKVQVRGPTNRLPLSELTLQRTES